MIKLTENVLPEQEYLSEEEQRFVVDDDQKAEWCLEKIREANETKEKFKAHYEEQLGKIEARCDFRIEYMQRLLWDYFETVPRKVTKTQQSYQLPSGKLVLKHQGPEFERDDELILAWLKANDDKYIKIKASVDWAELKKTLTICGEQVAGETGEIIPGIIVHERDDAFKVEVKA